jgi:hypothetical protein
MKHTDAATISQGLKQYLRTCSTSGLPSVRARGELLASMSKGERMAAYKAEFGQHFKVASAPNAPKGGNMSIEAAVEALRAAGIEVTLPEVETPSESVSFVKGTRFAFTSQKGNRREHLIERVSKGRVYTDQGQDFAISALNGYAAERVEVLS